MTYFEAISIKQDLIVNIQYSGVFKKQPAESLKEAAEKYTSEQMAAALAAIKKHMKEEYEDTKMLFLLAMQSKAINAKGNETNRDTGQKRRKK